MIQINDVKKLNNYILKYNINDIFTNDMSSHMELLVFKKNEYLCKDGEKLNYLFFFVEGKAKVYTTLSNGKSLLLCFYEDFRILGDVEIINGQNVATNVQALEDTYCIGLPLRKVRKQLVEDVKFLRTVCNSLGQKLNRSSNNSSINLLYPLENRLASYIIATSERINSDGNNIIEFKGNLVEIAELLGTSYRHLLRVLNDLCMKGAIKRKDKAFQIINDNILKQLASDLYK